MRVRSVVAATAMALAGALVATGCGADDPTPIEQAPQLAVLLRKVDTAVDDGRLRRAHAAVNDLMRATAAARESGTLDDADAEAVLAAAAQLLSALPARPAPTTTTTPTSEPPPQGQGEGDNENGKHKGADHGHGDGKGHGGSKGSKGEH